MIGSARGLRSDFACAPIVRPKDKPSRIDGAEWQAGITPGNATRRILLNGEPVPFAFAASETKGWVMAFCEPSEYSGIGRTPGYLIPSDDLRLNPATRNHAAYKLLKGHVQIVSGDADYDTGLNSL